MKKVKWVFLAGAVLATIASAPPASAGQMDQWEFGYTGLYRVDADQRTEGRHGVQKSEDSDDLDGFGVGYTCISRDPGWVVGWNTMASLNWGDMTGESRRHRRYAAEAVYRAESFGGPRCGSEWDVDVTVLSLHTGPRFQWNTDCDVKPYLQFGPSVAAVWGDYDTGSRGRWGGTAHDSDCEAIFAAHLLFGVQIGLFDVKAGWLFPFDDVTLEAGNSKLSLFTNDVSPMLTAGATIPF